VRRRTLVGVLAAAVIGSLMACAASWFGETPRDLTRAADAADATAKRMAVGRNVQVSALRPRTNHDGCTIVADPRNPQRLFAASMHWHTPNASGVIGYYSHDGGATWRLGIERLRRKVGERLGDEGLAYAPDGGLYFAHMRGMVGNQKSGVSTEFVYSGDGGKAWEERGAIDRFRRPAATRCGLPLPRPTLLQRRKQRAAFLRVGRWSEDAASGQTSRSAARHGLSEQPRRSSGRHGARGVLQGRGQRVGATRYSDVAIDRWGQDFCGRCACSDGMATCACALQQRALGGLPAPFGRPGQRPLRRSPLLRLGGRRHVGREVRAVQRNGRWYQATDVQLRISSGGTGAGGIFWMLRRWDKCWMRGFLRRT
jgi:hypothetical protein